MFKIVDSYIMKETLGPLFLSLIVFTFALISGNFLKLADLIIDKGVSFYMIFNLFTCLIPYLLSYTLPMSILASLIISFGQLSQNNEILALQASGMSLYKITWPMLIFGLCMTALSLFINNPLVCKSHYKMRMALLDMGYKNPTTLLEPKRFIETFDRYRFYINEIKGKNLNQIIIYETLENQNIRTITAEKGTLETNPQNNGLILHLVNGTADEPDPSNMQKFYKMKFKSFPVILKMNESKRKLAIKNKRLKEMTIKEIKRKILSFEKKDLPSYRYKAEIHRKISFSFASFIFILIGIPLAVTLKKGDKSFSIGITIILATIYYILFSIGQTIGEQNILPCWVAMWLPNIILGTIGIYLFYKVEHI